MDSNIYSLIPKHKISGILQTLHSFTGLSIDLIDSAGRLLLRFGESPNYCSILKNTIFTNDECFRMHNKAGRHAQRIGEAYIFSCHANLNHIAFPLINHDELLGSIIIGPFLMDKPDSTLISDHASARAVRRAGRHTGHRALPRQRPQTAGGLPAHAAHAGRAYAPHGDAEEDVSAGEDKRDDTGL